MQEGRPIAFESRKLSPAEVNYTTGEQELLVVVHAMRTWRCYLEGVEFTVVIDHCPLTFFQTQQVLSRRQTRWSEFLSQFRFQWIYWPGRTNVADPLSRDVVRLALLTRSARVRDQPVAADTGEVPTIDSVTPDCRDPESDMDFSDFVQRVRAGYSSDPWFQDRPNTKRLTLKNRLWWCGDSIAVPDVGNLRKEVLNELHDAPYSGHYGFHKTLKSISTLYWWPDLRQDVWNHVRNCDVCQRDKVSHQKPVGLLQPLEIPDRKWECVSMDFITGLTPSKKGNDAILVVVDKLSKMAHFIPTTTIGVR